MWHEHLRPAYHTFFVSVIGVLFAVGLLNTIWQIAEFREWPRGGEYSIAKDEYAISQILNAQTQSQKLYTIFHFSWNTIGFYTRNRALPIEIAQLGDTVDPEPFFLLIPTDILASIELHPLILERGEVIFAGDTLTLLTVHAAS